MGPWQFDSFESAGQGILKFLHQRLGFDLWMITRTEGDDWIVLQTEDHGYGVKPGQVFRWVDSFCSHMVKGDGPCIAPRSNDIELYATAPIARQVNIQAYIGQPLLKSNGELFGTLCAIDPKPRDETLKKEKDLIEFMAALLTHLLHIDLKQTEQLRQIERLQAKAMTDELTQLYNRGGWEHFIALEEERSQRYGNLSAVYVIDLDGLKEINDTQGHAVGDHLIQQAASALRNIARKSDIVARLGGDEFSILSVDLDHAGAESLFERIRQCLSEEQIDASIGFALRHPSFGLKQAISQADQQMYFHKRSKKASKAELAVEQQLKAKHQHQ
jgi:diguanylate cyclase (GGDEF)-like protein